MPSFIDRSTRKRYLHFIGPSLLSYGLASAFAIVDGLFVGNFVGDAGLAAVNVGWPVAQLAMALGTGIGMGGAVITSIELGRGRSERFNPVAGNTFVLLGIAAVVLAIVVFAFPVQLAWLMGGRGDVHLQAESYLTMIVFGLPFQLLASGFIPLIRNKGAVRLAMIASIAAGVFNVLLDFVFIAWLGMGTAGAALATSLSMVFEFLICGGFFLLRENRVSLRDIRLSAATTAHTLKLGVAPFGLNILPELTVVVININAALYGGEPALAAYAVIAYVVVVLQLFIQGIGDGSQPLVSQGFGAGEQSLVRRLLNTNYLVTIVMGAVGILLVFVLRYQIPAWFGASPAIIELVAYAMPIFCTSYLFYAIAHTTTGFLYAIDKHREANALVVAEFVLMVLCVSLLAAGFGVDGIWVSPIVVQAPLSLVALALLYRNRSVFAPAADRGMSA